MFQIKYTQKNYFQLSDYVQIIGYLKEAETEVHGKTLSILESSPRVTGLRGCTLASGLGSEK